MDQSESRIFQEKRGLQEVGMDARLLWARELGILRG